MKKKTGNKAKIKSWVRWHRRIGIFFALPAILLSITGILLNHSGFLKLDKTYITNSSILAWYGMEPSSSPEAISIGNNTITLIENLLYVNEKRVLEGAKGLTGGGELNKMLIVSTKDSVLLLEKDTNNIIEKLGSESLPGGDIISSSIKDNKYLLDTTKGRFSASPEITNFLTNEREALPKANPTSISKELLETILHDWRGRGLSLWRIILDLHSGKFFGSIGTFIADIFAMSLLFLVATGFYLWRKRPPV